MGTPTLVIGTKAYSSWSLRPWLLLKHFDVDFIEVQLTLDTPMFAQQVRQWSPTSRVPVLVDGNLNVWDSLAICEYINEAFLNGKAWPASQPDRALARSLVAEMHAGFACMRNEMPMDVRRRPAAVRLSDAGIADVARVQQIWDDCTVKGGNSWLLGDFSIVDAFFAPVAFRFAGYATELTTSSERYRDRLLAHPAMLDWAQQSEREADRNRTIEHG